VRELPILFKPEMHRAIREGRKTATRRLVKGVTSPSTRAVERDGTWEFWGPKDDEGRALLYEWGVKPRYQVGDRLWVKEAWRARANFDDLKPVDIGKRVGKEVRYELDGAMSFEQRIPFTAGKLRSPLFMPYWAARTWLEVTGVRAERLQEITEKGADAEGVSTDAIIECEGAVGAYSVLWEKINGKGSWEANPWVWVYRFKLLEAK